MSQSYIDLPSIQHRKVTINIFQIQSKFFRYELLFLENDKVDGVFMYKIHAQ